MQKLMLKEVKHGNDDKNINEIMKFLMMKRKKSFRLVKFLQVKNITMVKLIL